MSILDFELIIYLKDMCKFSAEWMISDFILMNVQD